MHIEWLWRTPIGYAVAVSLVLWFWLNIWEILRVWRKEKRKRAKK